MTSVAQGDPANLYKNLCRDATGDAAYKEDDPMKRAAVLALLIHNDAQNACKYHMDFTSFADIIIGYVATYYYNHRLSSGAISLQSTGIPPVTRNIVQILEEFHKLVKKYDVNAKRSWRSKASKVLSSGSGREKIGQIRNRFSSEHKSQAEALRRPIPRPESGSSNQHLNAPYDGQQRNNSASGSRSVVQQSPISIHSATQRSAPVDAQHATLPPPTIDSKLHPNTRLPDAEAMDSESVLDTPYLEHHTSAFSSPTRETPPDNPTPVETKIIPRYLDYEASVLTVESDRRSNTTSSGSSQGSSSHHPGASRPGHTYSPSQNYPSSARDRLGPLIDRPGPIVIHASLNSEGNQTRFIHRDS